MESNIHITRDKNKPNNLSLPNHKFKKHINTNKRYQNIQKKPQNPQNPSLSNNNLLYTSYQRKGYNGLFDPSLSGNNNFLIIKNIGLSPNQNSKNILIDKKSYTKSNRTEISKSQLLKNSHKNQYQNQVLSKKIDNKKNNVFLESNHNVKYDNITIEKIIDLLSDENYVNKHYRECSVIASLLNIYEKANKKITSLNKEYNKLLDHHPIYDRLITLIQELKSKEINNRIKTVSKLSRRVVNEILGNYIITMKKDQRKELIKVITEDEQIINFIQQDKLPNIMNRDRQIKIG